MIFRQLFDRESSTFTYVIACEQTRAAAIVDPVREHVARDLALLADLGLTVAHVFDTHVHADHVTGAGEIRKRTNAVTHVSSDGGAPCADAMMRDGDDVPIGETVRVRVLATPGHTSGCVSLVVGHAEGPDGPLKFDRVLTGDALLVRGCGRTDFQGGDAKTLYRSIQDKLFALPDETSVFPAHDYNGFSMSTIAEEKRLNPRAGGGRTEEEFVSIMRALVLPRPLKIDEAVPANRACGDAPPVTPPKQG